MSEPTVEYVELNRPVKVDDHYNIWVFGAYRVQIDDFVYMSPQSGQPGTPPIPLDGTGYREMLIDAARRAKETA